MLDIGTTKIACLIGRTESDGTLRVLGFGWQRGRGVRAGGIVDIEDAENAIRACVGQAEDMADTRLRAVTVNLSCGQPDIAAVQRAMAGERPRGRRAGHPPRGDRRPRAAPGEGREVIHALPLTFSTDEMEGVADPRGLYCSTLTARLHMVDSGSTALRTLGACIARCDLDIAELVSAPMAAGLATLVEDERELGATVIDMGGGTTGMAVFAEGQLLHTAQLPIGGVHVTKDLAAGLSTSLAHAERLKTLYGNVQSSPDDEREMLPVPLVGEEEHQIAKVPRSMVVNIIRPRLEETFEWVQGAAGSCRPDARRGQPRGADRRRLPARRRARDGGAHADRARCGWAGRSRCAACRIRRPARRSPPPRACCTGPPAKAARCTTSISRRATHRPVPPHRQFSSGAQFDASRIAPLPA